jgi:hypothetical protein
MPARPELSLRLPNSPGSLAAICRELAAERIQIHALSLEASGTLRLIVDNHVRAIGVLQERHRSLNTRDVIVVAASGTDALAAAVGLVAGAGVNVEYAYVGPGAGTGSGVAVLGVDDPQRGAMAAGV